MAKKKREFTTKQKVILGSVVLLGIGVSLWLFFKKGKAK